MDAAMGGCGLTLEIERVKRLTDPAEFEAGVALYRRGAVALSASGAAASDESRLYVVDGTPPRLVRVRTAAGLRGRCTCAAFVENQRPCRHMVAALLYANRNGWLAQEQTQRARTASEDLRRALEPHLRFENRLRLEVTLRHQPQDARFPLHVALKVGEERLYVVRSIPQMLDDLAARRPVAFGKGFVLQPDWMAFSATDKRLLETLREWCALCQDASPKTPPTGKYLPLPAPYARRVLYVLAARPFVLESGDRLYAQQRVWTGMLPLKADVRQAGRDLHVVVKIPPTAAPLTPDAAFVWSDGEVLRIPAAQREPLRAVFAHAQQGRAEFRLAGREAEHWISELLPRLGCVGEVALDGALAQRIVRKPLAASVYLDREGRGVAARAVFQYGETQLDPFAPQGEAEADKGAPEEANLLLMRDAAAEQRVLDVLAKAGFHVRACRAYLHGAEALYRFLTQGVAVLQGVAQVYCSEDFQRMAPRRPQLSGTLRLYDGLLRLELAENGAPVEELLPLLEALRSRKKYFVLKSGALLDLTALDEWLPLADAMAEAGAASEPARADTQAEGTAREPHAGLALPASRAMYLAWLLGEGGLPVSLDEGVRQMVSALDGEGDPCPAPLDGILRGYQLRGFAWLQALYRLRMGGILADDMGLGKTLQAIALMLWYRRTQGDLPALVVAPSSLVYNWQAELARYAPELCVLVLEGSQTARQAALARVAEQGGVDVLITSYPLLRRDIGILRTLPVSVALLDEAQYIKNPVSMGATAARELCAQARFALTGTPMENHPGELWSLFEFVLPGYLGSFARFMHRHGEGQGLAQLRHKTQPFLMRRLKRDVLADLPEKLETRLLAEMTVEQRRVYQASMLRLRREVDVLLTQEGIQRGRMAVLAAITELRQICCHPVLCLRDYSASSGKMDALMDLLPGALEAGHRVLVFSQFTGMLRILQRRMEASGIACLYLDGDTPTKHRLQLVQRFNGGEGQVFLISLRAGGSGLNLTGADMVVHYDPWWNPAAEDQATDRAHRIGQTRAVQVIRLTTRNSIEEQVVHLGERKRALFDAMVSAGEYAPAQFTEAELRALLGDLTEGGGLP